MIQARAAPSNPGSRGSASGELAWRLVPASEFDNCVRVWNTVFAQVKRPPILEARFMKTALAVFGRGDEVLAICGHEDVPRAIGIFRKVGANVWETFQPAQAPLGAWMHHPDVSYEDLLSGLIAALPGFALAIGITQRDPEILPRPSESGRLRVVDYVHTARIVVNRSFAEYWAGRDKKIRYEIRRRERRLVEEGLAPSLEVLRDPEDVNAAIEDYGRLESGGWKGAAGTAVRVDNDQGVFYRQVLREFCGAGRGRIYRLRFGERAVALQLCVESEDTLVFLKTAYDEEYRRFGPGILLKHVIFDHVFTEGRIRNIEFYGSVLAWQEKWMDDARTLYHVNFYRWPLLRALKRARNVAARRARFTR